MTTLKTIPYVVGQWVRGDRFYGRQAVLSEILTGPRESLWLVGTRRIGKTSLLKELESRASVETSGFVPLFWDFQGADDPRELHLSFHDALLDAEERLAALDVDLSTLDPEDLFGSLSRLRRHLRSTGKRLLLLCDEVEELIKLQSKDRSLLRKLRSALQSGGEVRSVLTSTIRLWVLAEERGDTSPFLHGFAPPLYLAKMTDEGARSLLRQEHLPEAARPVLETEVVEALRQPCDNHPYLLQLVGKRYLEVGDVDEALERLASDEMVSYFFAVDFEMLSPQEQQILRTVAEMTAATSGSLEERLDLTASPVAGGLLRLENLGFLSRNAERQLVLGNRFFQEWIRRSASQGSSRADLGTETPPFAERVTEILSQIDTRTKEDGAASPQELLEVVYDDLRQLARRYMSRERANHTLQPTALVHEAYMKLADQSRVEWQGRTHFYAVGAQAMRRILIDHARGRQRNKRGGDWLRVTWAEEVFPGGKRDLSDEELMDLDQAIIELTAIDERQARVVELRFFGGLTVKEVAEALGVSERTADGDWAKAREWLKGRLSREVDPS
jgi:RNA polymerase sigma factor (TIGR02999 family)